MYSAPDNNVKLFQQSGSHLFNGGYEYEAQDAPSNQAKYYCLELRWGLSLGMCFSHAETLGMKDSIAMDCLIMRKKCSMRLLEWIYETLLIRTRKFQAQLEQISPAPLQNHCIQSVDQAKKEGDNHLTKFSWIAQQL